MFECAHRGFMSTCRNPQNSLVPSPSSPPPPALSSSSVNLARRFCYLSISLEAVGRYIGISRDTRQLSDFASIQALIFLCQELDNFLLISHVLPLYRSMSMFSDLFTDKKVPMQELGEKSRVEWKMVDTSFRSATGSRTGMKLCQIFL